jgi:multimeric flavodoxin WrbA
MSDTIFLLGSSRSDGNTSEVVLKLAKGEECQILDLNEFNLTPFDYDHRNANDDFEKLILLILKSRTIVFSTPVYWYSMSAQMKIFFDRTSDLITIRKPLGRALTGMETFLVATGAQDALPEGFEVPFRRTSDYFNMKYRGSLYVNVRGESGEVEILRFKSRLFHKVL